MTSQKRKIGGALFSVMILILVAVVLTPALSSTEGRNGYGYGYCTPKTPGYWKNHPEAWPVETIMIGGVSYSKDDAIDNIKASGSGDKTYSMFEHLVAAKLNVLNGCDEGCIGDTIDDADDWLTDNPFDSNVRGNSDAWKDTGEEIKDMLDDFNNGNFCF